MGSIPLRSMFFWIFENHFLTEIPQLENKNKKKKFIIYYCVKSKSIVIKEDVFNLLEYDGLKEDIPIFDFERYSCYKESKL